MNTTTPTVTPTERDYLLADRILFGHHPDYLTAASVSKEEAARLISEYVADLREQLDACKSVLKEWQDAERTQRECGDRLRQALMFYASAPWVGHAGSWAYSDLARVATTALGER